MRLDCLSSDLEDGDLNGASSIAQAKLFLSILKKNEPKEEVKIENIITTNDNIDISMLSESEISNAFALYGEYKAAETQDSWNKILAFKAKITLSQNRSFDFLSIEAKRKIEDLASAKYKSLIDGCDKIETTNTREFIATGAIGSSQWTSKTISPADRAIIDGKIEAYRSLLTEKAIELSLR